MVRGQIAYKSHPRVLSKHHYRFQSENRQKGKRCRFSQSGQLQFGLYTGNCCYDRIRLTSLNQSAFLLHACAVGKAIFDTRKYADYVT